MKNPQTHALAYSFVGIQTLYLATNFPSIYWNCACLIVNAGGADLLEVDEVTDDDNEEVTTTKKKNKSVNYGKISAAIGESISKGIKILPPDINKSDLIFKPDLERNAIIYGMKGITRIGTQLVYDIFKNRPYTSIEDFMSKVKVNKTQMINLIKSGAFDELYKNNRIYIMDLYIDKIADKKKRITLQNMQMLISKNLIPEELDFQRRIFNFTKYIKKSKKDNVYKLDDVAINFIETNYSLDIIKNLEINGNERSGELEINAWDNIYQKEMNKVRVWMKSNQQDILNNLNNVLMNETKEKYCSGSVSKWEMESLSFYYHEHELINLKNDVYDISDYNMLSEEPEIDRVFSTKNGDEITLFKIHRIAGTVIDKDKNKSQIILLTPTGVVTVKIWKNQYAKWDRQISEKGEDGKKHVVERSFFTKGNKLIITGIRRGDNFIPKKYKNTEYPIFEQIISMDDKGFIIESKTERAEVEE